jgi:hypothetical protein
MMEGEIVGSSLIEYMCNLPIIIIRGNYIFFPSIIKKMRNTPTNYQLDQNRESNYKFYTFCLIPFIRPINIDGIC